MSEPCVLIQEGELWKCQRHGMYHNGKMREYALGTDEKSIEVRAGWDKLTNRHHDSPLPPLHKRAANYLASLAEHTANSRKTVPLSVRDYRWNICEPCEHRNREQNACSLCGCPLNANNALGDKLSWEVSECPKKKWRRVDSTHAQDDARHLLFHLWPRKLSLGTWQRNLDQLKARWNMFTGKRVIAIATSSDSHDLGTVQSYMQGYNCEWIEVKNDPDLREVKTFHLLFERIEGYPGFTFYAQGKGVTKPVDRGVSIHNWTSAMYEILLDYWPLVQEHLQKHPIVGAFKKGIAGFTGSPSNWHYSGSFCWLNNAQLWKRNWKNIEQVWFGIESWPSMIFTSEEAACLFHCRNQRFDLYSMAYWRSVEKELAKWRREKAPYRSDIGSLTIGSSR